MNGLGSRVLTSVRSIAKRHRAIFGASGDGQAYTIVEVMIFLAVSAALFAMVTVVFSGRQARTEFATSARDMESRLQDIANDVSTGFYNNPGNFRCRVSGSTPVIDTVSPNQQGTNDDCIFIGRVAHFDLDVGGGRQYNVYSVVGARQTIAGEDVEDFDQANPLAIASPVSPVNLTESQQIPPGLVVRSMYAEDGGAPRRIRAIGFFTTFGSGSSSADPSSLSVNIMPLGIATGNSQNAVVPTISGVDNAYFDTYGNPSNGVVVCMEGDGTGQRALLRLGGNERQLTTDLIIEEGTCAEAGYPA